MANLWRRQPSKRLRSNYFVKKGVSDATPTIAATFFEAGGAPPIYYGILKRWTGSGWAKEPLKVFLGSWLFKPLKRWTGSQWVQVDTTGV